MDFDKVEYLSKTLKILTKESRIAMLFSLYEGDRHLGRLAKDADTSKEEAIKDIEILIQENLITEVDPGRFSLFGKKYTLVKNGEFERVKDFIDGLKSYWEHFLYHYTH